MVSTLADTEIMDLLEEEKPLPEKYRDRLQPKRKSAYQHEERELEVNRIERNSFHDFHIHKATERYQLGDYPIDGYAEVTDAYSTFEEALNAFLKDCHFELPPRHQRSLFEWGGVENEY